ncbi:MAG: N-acetyltransferase [Defluviitaleaceae bacterium]|nr:N-acetyltransferase [Defluviitaleaceae bacterium]
MNIRLEQPTDYYEIEELTRNTFWTHYWGEGMTICDEHLLVHRLRKSPSFVPALDFVAEIDDKLVGHIIYSESKIKNDLSEEYVVLTFGPLSVLPEYQGRGIGKALMRHSFDAARQLGYPAVIIFGHPDYYPRVGFRRASEFGITAANGTAYDSLMVYPLYENENALDGIHGRFILDPVYESLTQADALEYDKRFPPKEAHIPIPINILLDRLEPTARKEIQALNLSSLALIATKSQRELSELNGIDAAAIQTIRAVMQENGFLWGSGNTP